MYQNYSYFVDASGNPVTQSVVSVTDSSGNPVTGKFSLLNKNQLVIPISFLSKPALQVSETV